MNDSENYDNNDSIDNDNDNTNDNDDDDNNNKQIKKIILDENGNPISKNEYKRRLKAEKYIKIKKVFYSIIYFFKVIMIIIKIIV